MTPTQEALQRAAEALVFQVDESLKSAITERLGRDDWTLQELRGSLSLLQQSGTDRYFLAGKPLLTVHPLCEHELSGTSRVWTRGIQTHADSCKNLTPSRARAFVTD